MFPLSYHTLSFLSLCLPSPLLRLVCGRCISLPEPTFTTSSRRGFAVFAEMQTRPLRVVEVLRSSQRLCGNLIFDGGTQWSSSTCKRVGLTAIAQTLRTFPQKIVTVDPQSQSSRSRYRPAMLKRVPLVVPEALRYSAGVPKQHHNSAVSPLEPTIYQFTPVQ
ncbi:hypothetical protein C8R46DRAFT_1023641 [Mycena filopes]|nr:hypothetical protein C8R46DRAFT_1023641 [Mycena filopes]